MVHLNHLTLWPAFDTVHNYVGIGLYRSLLVVVLQYVEPELDNKTVRDRCSSRG